MDIVRMRWKGLCESIFSSSVVTTKENPKMIRQTRHKIGVEDEPRMTDETRVQLTLGNDENQEHEADCDSILENDVIDSCPQCAEYFGMGNSLIEPALLKAKKGPLTETQIVSDYHTASESDGECLNELGIPAYNTSNERGNISNTLKKLIENIAPTAVEISDGSAVTELPPKKTAAINLSSCYYKVVEDVAKRLGMKVTSQDRCWDVIWYSRPITEEVCAKFSANQRANYFPESQRVVWKNNLALCLTKMWDMFPRDYDFFPKSWSLPRDWHLMEKHARRHPKEWYIVKPNNWGCGYGIYLTSEVTKLSSCGRMTAQIYIKKPYLIDDLKFDLRIYVLVTSCKPLRIFVYNEGLARFATDKYQEPDHQNKTNRYMHLTNYAVNKTSPTYVVDENKGTLRRWTTVSELLADHEIDAKTISASMDDVIIKTIIAMSPTLKYHYFRSFPDQVDSNSCFQIFGFDIMFGSELKVYVLEVNGSPQFHADVTLDIEMTKNLIQDTFSILNLAEKPRDPSSLVIRKKNVSTPKQPDSRTTTQRRIEWENSHLGNFRKIYPNEHNKFYNKFMKAANHFIRPL